MCSCAVRNAAFTFGAYLSDHYTNRPPETVSGNLGAVQDYSLAQALAAVPPEQLLANLRWRRGLSLVPTVRALPGGYRVGTIGKDSEYLYEGPDGDLVCSCKEYERFELEPGYACRHMVAVSLAKRQARLVLSLSPTGSHQ